MFKSFWKPIIWASVIFFLSALPGYDLNKATSFIAFPNFDKVGHATFYFVLCWLLVHAFQNTLRPKKSNKILSYFLALFLCAIYGAIIEYLQGYIFIQRSKDIFDFIANCSGAVSAAIFYYFLAPFIYREKEG